ncbi:MAG TPA: MFS transporter [Candidatus Limnocylindrales bacterium]|nr:MFS transporter [Candidatus Limnocylindrales bacterium]
MRALVPIFALTQTVGYGVLFYAFGVFNGPIARDLNTSVTTVSGALTASVLATAAAAYPIGRRLDRLDGGGRYIMAGGSVAATAAVLALSQIRTVWQLYAVMVVIGLTSAAVLYEAAFAIVVKNINPPKRSRAILIITIVAGFASTIFMPLAGLLEERWGWRGALVVLAAIHGALTIFPHFSLVPRKTDSIEEASGPMLPLGTALRDRVFWLLATGFTASAAAGAAVAVHLVGYLLGMGHSTAVAASITGLLGAMSVTGRVLTTRLSTRFSTASIATVIFFAQGAAVLLLPLVARSVAGATACVLVFGLGFGIASIARPSILADRYGATAFGSISGTLTVPVALARAAAPLAVAALTITSLPLFTSINTLLAAACLGAAAATAARPA